ncbi:MAG TPA: MIP/aquaporin family protein [Candidatus Limnocylindria bacterium]|nr:MIP/aquaporin family protein [Candidatus Limnocylindria bacterium]HEX2884078.1 MIP/aquaporin family protein [Candidatus Limnocylindria bacterium]
MLTDGFSIFIAETVGTGLLILFGDGVVAGVLLARSKAQNAGWIVITTGWALAVAVGVYAIGSLTGAHLNPAVTIGFAVAGTTDWGLVPWYIAGEMLGAFLGAVLVYFHYLPHWAETEDPGLKLAVFSTGPAIRNTVSNLISEIIGTFALVFGVYAIVANELAPGFAALLVGFLVWGIGLSLGGPTGYAINPARDLGPRIAHAILPIAGKGSSDWEYSWIPVVGPIIGGILGAVAYQALFTNWLLA